MVSVLGWGYIRDLFSVQYCSSSCWRLCLESAGKVCLWNCFYADDLVLMTELEKLLMEKLRKWKKGMEAKGLRMNAGKTKVMQCRVSRFQSEDSGEHPCGVCRRGFGDNAILCGKSLRWVHKRCSGISGKLMSNVDFPCRRCLEGENGLSVSFAKKGCD